MYAGTVKGIHAVSQSAPRLHIEARLSAEAWALLLALSLPWGGAFLLFRVLGQDLPSFTLVLARCGLAVPTLYLLLRLRGQRLDIPWVKFLVMGLLNNVIPFTLFAWAETRVTSGLAAILNAATPVMTVLVLAAFGVERLTTLRILGVVVAFAGVGVLIGPDAWAGSPDLLADAACLLATLSYAFTALWGRGLRHIDPIKAATGQLACSTLILLPLAAVIDQPWTLPMPSVATWTALLTFALVCTALAYIIFFRILAIAGSGNVMLVTFLIPVSALVMGALFLHEPITPSALAGMALIASGLAAIDGRLFRR